MMERVTSFSFWLWQTASLGLVVTYVVVTIAVAVTGYSIRGAILFSVVTFYSILLLSLLIRFQKKATRAIRALLLITLIPEVVLISWFIALIIYEGFGHNRDWIDGKVLVILILMPFVVSGIVVIRALIKWTPDSKH